MGSVAVQIRPFQDHQITAPVLESAGEDEFSREPVLWTTSYSVITWNRWPNSSAHSLGLKEMHSLVWVKTKLIHKSMDFQDISELVII